MLLIVVLLLLIIIILLWLVVVLLLLISTHSYYNKWMTHPHTTVWTWLKLIVSPTVLLTFSPLFLPLLFSISSFDIHRAHCAVCSLPLTVRCCFDVCTCLCVWRPGKILHTVKFVHFLLYKPEPKCFFYAWIETTSNTTASVFKVCLHPKVKGEKFAFKDSILTEAQDHCGHYDSW